MKSCFRERLAKLKGVHSGYEQAESAWRRGSHIRRDPIESIHPLGEFGLCVALLERRLICCLVRTRPATGEKGLYVNPQFTRYIVGFKKEESDYLLKFPYDHMAFSQDVQCRVK